MSVCVFSLLRFWMRSMSMESRFTTSLTPSLMRMKTSKSRLESWRWARVFLCFLLLCLCFFNESHSVGWVKSYICHSVTEPTCFFRLASRLQWWDPTSRLRPRGRRWGAACTPGEWWRWRIQSTTTSSSCGSCWCEWQRGSHNPQLSSFSKVLLSSGARVDPGCVAVKVNSLVCTHLL